jgi:hypothetical protein
MMEWVYIFVNFHLQPVSFVICCEDNTCAILVTLFTATMPKFEKWRSWVLGMGHSVFARCSHYSMCIGFFSWSAVEDCIWNYQKIHL